MTKPVTQQSFTPQQLSQAYEQACLAEIEAIKPGNVHIFADGHGMVVKDFIQSAAVSSKMIARADMALGERIYRTVEATWEDVGCNTNLGIVLLCAPIIQAALEPASMPLYDRLADVINSSTQMDADWMFKAITLANPGGLGQAEEHDVMLPAACTLLEAMATAANRDFIALQYKNGYQHIIEKGLIQYEYALSLWNNSAWAATALYLFWLSHYLDSHIVRKYGSKLAKTVKEESLEYYDGFLVHKNPKNYFAKLMTFDGSLKARNINPGTSADLTVATLLLYSVNTI